MNLNGTVGVVTGGATGIGAAVAEGLARAGAAAVVVNYSRSEQEAKETVARLRDLGCAAEAIRADVADDAQARRMADEVRDRYGRADVLVNNAGTTQWVAFDDLEGLTADVWRRIMDVNLLGAFHCARAFAPDLRAAGGAVVNVASIAGHRGIGSSLAYGVSKAALLQLTRGLAVALAPEVRVNSVSPGTVETRWHVDRVGEEGFAEMTRREHARVPLRRTAGPGDVADAVLALLAADLVTGEDLILDGGKYLTY